MSTIKSPVKLSGRGIHSGLPVDIVVKPSKKKGVFFKRTDLIGTGLISALYDNVCDTKMRNTTVGDLSGAHVKTIEHLMAALFMAGIDSAVIEINGSETPILDGSAVEFYRAFADAGVETDGDFEHIIVRKTVIVRAKEALKELPFFVRMKIYLMNFISGRKMDGFVKLSPSDNNALDITATLVYREKIIGAQTYSYLFDGTKKSINTFINDIARARTFGKYSEWEYLKAHGMGRGADETNVIALNDSGDGTLNPVFWPDEFVRHKIIDVIGDMFTSGGLVVGKLESYKGSHAMNNLILRKLFSDKSNYEIINQRKGKK